MSEILNKQYILFFKNDINIEFDNLSVKLKEKLGQSIATQILPIPQDAPAEIPRLILNYAKYNINISRNRVELPCKDLDNSLDILIDIVKVLTNQFSVIFNRIALVSTILVDENLSKLKKIINSDALSSDDITEIKLRVNKPITLDGFECNNIEDIEYVTIFMKPDTSPLPQVKKGLVINRDINTFPDKDYRFHDENIPKLVRSFNNTANSFVIFEK
ncbi:MAG TPA: hypothetical protein VN642_07310 [Dongiaceae bacterium]|nr:hypothetical protein [Dongiaceae bacterium]